MVCLYYSTNSLSDRTVYLTVTTDSVSVEVPVHFILLTTGRPVDQIYYKLFVQLMILRKLAAASLNPESSFPWSSASKSYLAFTMSRTVVPSHDVGSHPFNLCFNLQIAGLLYLNSEQY